MCEPSTENPDAVLVHRLAINSHKPRSKTAIWIPLQLSASKKYSWVWPVITLICNWDVMTSWEWDTTQIIRPEINYTSLLYTRSTYTCKNGYSCLIHIMLVVSLYHSSWKSGGSIHSGIISLTKSKLKHSLICLFVSFDELISIFDSVLTLRKHITYHLLLTAGGSGSWLPLII